MLSMLFTKGPVNDLVDAAMRPNRREEEVMAIYFEIADWVLSQKRNGPNKLTEVLLPKINSRGERNALIALDILDICVKNCGFPFHLHVCSTPFLREFIKYLPEKFPAPLTPVNQRILELLEFWKTSLYDFSRFKVDLKGLETVYYELLDKGFRFPKVKVDPSLIFVRSPLKTEDELIEEDMKAQSAKLDELLRRGTPSDLAAANDLMKVMAAHEFEKRPEYEAFVGIQIKNIEKECHVTLNLLNSLEKHLDPTEHFRVQELLNYLKSSHLKVKKEILDTDDDKKTGPLLALNDLLNSVFMRYEEVKADFLLNENNAAYRMLLQESMAKPQGPIENPFEEKGQPGRKEEEVPLIDLDIDALPSAPYQPSNLQAPFGNQPHSFQGQQPLAFVPSAPPIQMPPLMPLQSSVLPPPLPFPGQMRGPGAAVNSGAPTPKISSVFNQKGLEIQMRFEKPPSAPDTIKITARYINHLHLPMTDLSILFAVPKEMKIKTENTQNATLAPASMGGQPLTQQIFVHNPSFDQLRMRFKLAFKTPTNQVFEEGELGNIPAL